MTAALCPRCAGNPHHLEDGCTRCDDSGAEPAPRVHRYATERAAWMIARALERSDGADVPAVVRATYAEALREHARVVRPRAARSGWTAAEVEAGRVADACEEHARRIESAPMRAEVT